MHEQGTDERENRDRIDADPAVPSGVDHPPRGGRDSEHRGTRPRGIADALPSEEMREPASRKAYRGNREERHLSRGLLRLDMAVRGGVPPRGTTIRIHVSIVLQRHVLG